MWTTVGTAALVAFVLLSALIAILFLTRGTPIERVRLADEENDPLVAGDPLFCETFSVLTNTTLTRTNAIDLLFNGDGTYEPLLEALASAQRLITWHVFWFRPGTLADRVHDVLCERARAGVTVLVLLDYYGSHPLQKEYVDSLRSAGARVEWFRDLRWNTLYKVQQRSHMRTVVIDSRVGFTGGFGIDDRWLGDGRHEHQWRDTSVRVRGPIVRQLQAAFIADWAEATGELLAGDEVLALGNHSDAGDHLAGIMYAAPSLGSTNAERFFALSICGARERLYITNPYFIPDDDFRRFLAQAVSRGVDVRVLTPGRNTDKPSTWHAARAHYEELLESGVRIYEYRPTMVHAKTVVVDGVWASTGTINFDNRSMALNDEVALVTRDARIAGRLEEAFLEDLEYADEVTLPALRNRSWHYRIRERLALLLVRVL